MIEPTIKAAHTMATVLTNSVRLFAFGFSFCIERLPFRFLLYCFIISDFNLFFKRPRALR